MSYDAISMAIMIEAKDKTYNMPVPGFDEFKKTSPVIIDPLQTEHLKEKLLEYQLRHMQEFLSTWQQRAQAHTEANPRIVDFSPRYYAAAMRDLHRAVEWYRWLKENAM